MLVYRILRTTGLILGLFVHGCINIRDASFPEIQIFYKIQKSPDFLNVQKCPEKDFAPLPPQPPPGALKHAPGPPAMSRESSARYASQKFRKFCFNPLASLNMLFPNMALIT